jgi:broad specificity phosphatase PhoE
MAVWAGEPVQTTIVVVRHAEKQAEGADPELTQAGEARADSLAGLLRDAPVSAVLVTQYRRTVLTAAPVIEGHAPETVRLPVSSDEIQEHADLIRDRILADYAGATVLVVGHSNTVPAIVESFGPWTVEALSESDYDRLFVINHRPETRSSLIRARYGAPSPQPSESP